MTGTGSPGLRRASRIAFIGLRGAGKSTLGRMAAARLGLPFKELNEDIAEASGIPAGEVMALYGPEGYRHLERQSLERIVATYDRLVLAAAGGIVSQPETYNYLLRNFHTIWLKAAPEDFIVEEVPAYGPSGEGAHVFCTIEKRGRSTSQSTRRCRISSSAGDGSCRTT